MEKEKVFYTMLDKIIWEEWDPIGINFSLDARNEYYGYLPQIFEEALKSNNEIEIANLLFSIEKNRMGLDGNYERCLTVSKEILDTKNKLFKKG